MKISAYKIINLLVPVSFLALLGLGSCKDEVAQDFQPDRMFMPTGAIQSASGATSVLLSWKEALYVNPEEVSYTVEVSTDTLFQNPVVYSVVTDTAGVTLTDENLDIKRKYFARVKTNAAGSIPESRWVVSSGFQIRGEQIFLPFLGTDIKDRTVLLRWQSTPGLTRIVLVPAGGTPVEVPVTAADITASQKLLTNLTPSTTYAAEIFQNTRSKGQITFTTTEPSLYTITVATTDELTAAIANAVNNDVIGLEAGTYDLSGAATEISQKHITLQSVSSNPNNTKVLFKEFALKGDGAGIKLSGIEFDGGPGNASYFINLAGLNADADAANFKSILVENAIIHNTANCLIRGNRGGNNAHKIEFIRINNSVAYDNGSSSYNYIMIDKMEFERLELTNSTFYNTARAFLSWSTNITMAQKPTVLIDMVTINGFGFAGRDNILFDANANPVNFTMQNSILANAPKANATVGTSLVRASGAGSEVRFENNNYFNLTTGATPAVELSFPSYVVLTNNKTINLGWTATTTNFSLPASSELRTASKTGGVIGDLRWAL